jgi:hypothetical protein
MSKRLVITHKCHCERSEAISQGALKDCFVVKNTPRNDNPEMWVITSKTAVVKNANLCILALKILAARLC